MLRFVTSIGGGRGSTIICYVTISNFQNVLNFKNIIFSSLVFHWNCLHQSFVRNHILFSPQFLKSTLFEPSNHFSSTFFDIVWRFIGVSISGNVKKVDYVVSSFLGFDLFRIGFLDCFLWISWKLLLIVFLLIVW